MLIEIITTRTHYTLEEKNKLEGLPFRWKKSKSDDYGSKFWGPWRIDSGKKTIVEFLNTEEIIDFVKKYGEIIIQKSYADDTYLIEIYNDYRD